MKLPLALVFLASSLACRVPVPGAPSSTGSDWPALPSEGALSIDVGVTGAEVEVQRVRLAFLAAVNADGITREAEGSSILLTIVNSSTLEKPVIVLSSHQRVALEPREGRLSLQSDGAVGGTLAPDARAVLRLTATGVGDPEEPGEIIEVHSPGARTRIEAWIVPLLGEWKGAGRDGEDLDLGMVAFHAALLRRGDSGQVLFFSPPREKRADGSFKSRPAGSTRGGGYYWQLTALDDVEIALLDLATGEVEERPMDAPHNLFCSGHAHLPDGRLLVAGGHIGFFANNAEHLHLFDAGRESGWWKRLDAKLPETRWYPTVTALPDGKMLITSGRGAPLLGNLLDRLLGWYRTARKTYEIFDPETGTLVDIPAGEDVFVDDDELATYPSVMVLPGGEEHGEGVVFAQERNNAWLFGYDTRNGGRLTSRSAPYEMATLGSRSYPYYGSASLLPFEAGNPGRLRILIAGGQGETNEDHEDYDTEQLPTRTAEIFEFDRGLALGAQTGWRKVSPMAQARLLPSATHLADGTVLVSGGGRRGWTNCNDGDILLSELFDPDPGSERFYSMAPARYGRRYHSTVLLLPDGTLLSAGSSGGFNLNNECIQPVFRAERFLPPYLWKGPRPRIVQVAPASAVHGASWTVDVESEDTEGMRVTLVRLGSVTHGNNMDQRFLWLTEEGREELASGVRLRLSSPANGSVAPPGDYMLFVLDGARVPSLARFVRLFLPEDP